MKYFKRVDSNGYTTTVEAYSHSAEVPGGIECTREEFDDFIRLLPIPAKQPDRLEELEKRIAALERRATIEI